MPIDTTEQSVQDSRPRELYTITHGATTYLIASGERDVTFAGATYTGTACERSQLQLSDTAGGTHELVITLPASHPLPQRYVAQSSPPQLISVTALRVQIDTGDSIAIWSGFVTSVAFDGHIAKLNVRANGARQLARKLPMLRVGKSCGHILYDPGCTLDRLAHTYGATVLAVVGRVVTVSTISGQPDGAFTFGDLLHEPSGERMTIFDQTGTTITMQAPIVEIKVGDPVALALGCSHNIVTCKVKFSNVPNFGGQPVRPTSNPFFANGTGIVQL